MSLPPATVKIKRKATDDPVEFLRIHESGSSGKRQRQESGYIFSRQSIANNPAGSQLSSPAPRQIEQLYQSASSTLRQSNPTTPTTNCTPRSTPRSTPQPRRFHISRSSTPSNNTSAISGAYRKRKLKPTVFVERHLRPKSTDETPGDSPAPDESAGQITVSAQLSSISTEQIPAPDIKTQKKPGNNARSAVRSVTPPQSSPAPLRNVLLPNGSMMPWDVTSDQLAAEMQAYTLQEIGKTVAASEAPRLALVARRIKTPSKFKPKPALRYLERHPEHNTGMSMDVDEEYIVKDMDDEFEYIIETYIRVPADTLEVDDGPKNIGLLILDSQPDIDDFYREDEDSDEEEDDGDEDENAENHYTADYPDEEVDSDDEHGINAYNYRNNNTSDLEEFDEDDATLSEDESEATKYPWMTKPLVKKPATDTIMDDSD